MKHLAPRPAMSLVIHRAMDRVVCPLECSLGAAARRRVLCFSRFGSRPLDPGA